MPGRRASIYKFIIFIVIVITPVCAQVDGGVGVCGRQEPFNWKPLFSQPFLSLAAKYTNIFTGECYRWRVEECLNYVDLFYIHFNQTHLTSNRIVRMLNNVDTPHYREYVCSQCLHAQ